MLGPWGSPWQCGPDWSSSINKRLTCEASHVQLPEALDYLQVTEVRWSLVQDQLHQELRLHQQLPQ